MNTLTALVASILSSIPSTEAFSADLLNVTEGFYASVHGVTVRRIAVDAWEIAMDGNPRDIAWASERAHDVCFLNEMWAKGLAIEVP